MMLWCMISVMMDGAWVETAAKGKVLYQTDKVVTLDFSEYAKQQGYKGNYSRYSILRDYCIENKESK